MRFYLGLRFACRLCSYSGAFLKSVSQHGSGPLSLISFLLRRNIMDQQKHGIVLCIPKTTAPKTPADYRPIIWLNTGYKILARIVAIRLRPILADLLHTAHHGGLQGGGISDAVIWCGNNGLGRHSVRREDANHSGYPLSGFHGSVRHDLPHLSIQAAIGIWF